MMGHEHPSRRSLVDKSGKCSQFYCSEMSKQPIRTKSLSLKCAELRYKKSLGWQTYSLLTNQSGTNNERKRDKIIVHRGHIQQNQHL